MAEQPTNRLSRSLRERDLLLLFVGSVIGSGVFLTPGLILRQLGGSVGYSLLVWVMGGVLSLLGALTYAELAASKQADCIAIFEMGSGGCRRFYTDGDSF